MNPSDRPVERLLGDIDVEQQEALIKPAKVIDVVTLGGEDKLKAPPVPMSWRRWMLWAVMLGGVALLGWMVRRLIRQLGQARPSGG